MVDENKKKPKDFIRAKIDRDLRAGKYDRPIRTRFPPEPNGYLHIGHAKAICLNFGIAEEYEGATCNLRFDDTNPTKEEVEFVDSIQDDIRWLGFDWGPEAKFASDYFEQYYRFALKLIDRGKAYVCDLSLEEIREGRGTVREVGTESPYRDRPVAENLDLFARMRAGDFADGSRVLRAKIDMAAANMIMRDPVLYRIRRAHHYRTGDEWCLYPMYDFAHCLGDAIEGVTHSLCSIEFKDNRELYDWVLAAAGVEQPPEQTEFARLNLDYSVMSKRKLIRLVDEGHVTGWDDPRMLTIAGLRRRGVTPEAIRNFCEMVGVARADSRVDIGKLEFAIRDDLNPKVPRVMCVARPLKVVITNFPDETIEQLEAPLYPHDVPLEGSRNLPFTKEIFIERDDFAEDPPKGFFRLAPGREVRLRYAYFITCNDVIKGVSGEVVEVRCTYDPQTRGGDAPDGRKVKGTIHWVSVAESLACEIRLYDRLFSVPEPEDVPEDGDFFDNLNRDSVAILTDARIEPSVRSDAPGSRYQFERLGYFVSDSKDSKSDNLVYNRIVHLRDTWAKVNARHGGKPVVDDSRVKRDKRKSRPRRAEAGGTSVVRSLSTEQEKTAARYVEIGVSDDEARILAGDGTVSRFFENAVRAHDDPIAVANFMVNELLRDGRAATLGELSLQAGEFGALVALVSKGTITRTVAKDVLADMVKSGATAESIIAKNDLAQMSDESDLEKIVEKVLLANAESVVKYRAGKTALAGFFVGQVMKETMGRANPGVVKQILDEKLES